MTTTTQIDEVKAICAELSAAQDAVRSAIAKSKECPSLASLELSKELGEQYDRFSWMMSDVWAQLDNRS